MVEADDPRLSALAELHKMDPAAGGGMPCALERLHGLGSGRGNHDSETVFALLPDDTEGCQGFLLRDMGYSVKEPVAGRFRLDEEKSLWLSTNYEMMDSGECFLVRRTQYPTTHQHRAGTLQHGLALHGDQGSR